MKSTDLCACGCGETLEDLRDPGHPLVKATGLGLLLHLIFDDVPEPATNSAATAAPVPAAG